MLDFLSMIDIVIFVPFQVAMYKRLYEEEQKLHSSDSRSSDLSPGSTSMHHYEFTALRVLKYPRSLTSWLILIK